MRTYCLLACAALIAAGPRLLHAQDTTAEHDRTALTHTLPHADSAYTSVQIVEVIYGPGGGSAPHRHGCPVFGYVVSGTLRTKSGDEPEATYTAGQTFYEAPNALHAVSANASQKRPVKFLATFVCAGHSSP